MKRITVYFLVTFLIGSQAFAQSYLILARPIKTGLWNYYTIKGEPILDRQYRTDYYEFSEDGVAVVGEDYYTLINAKGEEIKTETKGAKIRLKDFHGRNPKGFSDGLIIVRQGKYGCLDTSGRIKIPFKYYDITPFNNGYATARIKNRFFVIDKKGREIAIGDTTIVDIEHFKENMASFQTSAHRSGFIDTTGNVVIAARFDGVGHFSNGVAWARDDNDRIGYINRKGEWVIQPNFAAAMNFDVDSGIARAKRKTKEIVTDTDGSKKAVDVWRWHYINFNGEVLPVESSHDVVDFSNGLARSQKSNRHGFIDNQGKWVIQPTFQDVHDFNNGLACAKQGGLWGVIDKQGNWVLKPMFEAVKDVVKIK